MYGEGMSESASSQIWTSEWDVYLDGKMRDGWIAARTFAAFLLVRLVGGGDGVRTGVLKKSVVRDRAGVGVELESLAILDDVSAENGDAKNAWVFAPVDGWMSENRELDELEHDRTELPDDDSGWSGHGEEKGERWRGRGRRCWTAIV